MPNNLRKNIKQTNISMPIIKYTIQTYAHLQHGFQQNISIESLLFEVHDRISNTLNDGKLAIIISLHLSKAFDSLNHFQLIIKLRDIGFKIKAEKSIISYLRKKL